MNDSLIAALMQLFDGYSDAHGVYNVNKDAGEGGKVLGKRWSAKGKVTPELWDLHLQAKQGLGIIPINGESLVKFGAIDIDEYPIDLVAINKNIIDNELPLVTIRTKSGGAHLYMFMAKWTSAKAVIMKLREFAAFLGYGNSEVFPKQTKMLVDRGDIGSWINMPYFDMGQTMRYALGDNHKALSIEQFIEYAQSKLVLEEELKHIQLRVPEVLPDGPPCLQQVIQTGFPEGTRNGGMFNLAVYARKAFPDSWESKIEAYNAKYMDPPLSTTEVLGIIKSMKRKEYAYTCNMPPIQSFCNKEKCRACKHGVGGGDVGMPVFGTLTKVLTEPPIWFLDVEGGGRVQMTTEDLQSSSKFQLRCMAALNIMPNVLKREGWQAIVQKMMANVNIVPIPEGSTPREMLFAHLQDFLTSRVQAHSIDEVLLGKPWLGGKHHYFRMRDFLKYLERQKFDHYGMHQIVVLFKDELKADHTFKQVHNTGVNLWMVPVYAKQEKSFQTPKVEENTEY